MKPQEAEALTETLAALVSHLRGEMRGLEKRLLAEIERKAFDYTGVHKQGQSYRKGQGCTHDGSIFIAMKDYPGTPGTPNSGWRLACKRGRDAR